MHGNVVHTVLMDTLAAFDENVHLEKNILAIRGGPRTGRAAGYLEISAPVFCLVMFHGGSYCFANAASGSYPQMG
jgi:hypothetical protein